MNGLKQIRTQCDFSVTDIAKKLGVSKQAVSSWENGKKEIPEARRRQLALLFGVDASVFDDLSDYPAKIKRLSYSEEYQSPSFRGIATRWSSWRSKEREKV